MAYLALLICSFRSPSVSTLIDSTALTSAPTVVHRDLIVELAARHNLPTVFAFRFFVASGGLMSYGINFVDVFRQAASYVDRILRGAKPTDLPVQTPPPGLLVAADEVIE